MEYGFLQKPTLLDLVALLDKSSRSTSLSLTQQTVYSSLLAKMQGLKSFTVLSEYPTGKISENMDFFYADMGEIKDYPKIFIALSWLLLKQWMRIDRKSFIERAKNGQPRQKIFYVIEEAHNFFKVPAFARLFQNATKEARKFGVHFMFIIHTVEDVPTDVYASISTKIFILKSGAADEVKMEIEKKTAMSGERLEVFERTRNIPRAMYILHDDGETGCRLEISKEELEVFSPKKVD